MSDFFAPFFDGFGQILAWLFDLTKSYGFSIMLLTLIVRVIVTPLTLKSTRSMMAMQRYQPEIKEIQQTYKHDKQQLNEELLRFYRENQINPAGTCIPILIQMPVFILLWQVVRGITTRGDDGLFTPSHLNASTQLFQSLKGAKEMPFLGIDLARSASQVLKGDGFVSALPYMLILLVITGSTYYQQRQIAGRTPNSSMNPTQKRMMQMLPLVYGVFSFNFAGALALYMLTSNVYQIGQQAYISKAFYGKDKMSSESDAADTGPSPKLDKPPPVQDKQPSKSDRTPSAKPTSQNGRTTPAKRPPSGRVTPKATTGDVPQRRPGAMPPRRTPFSGGGNAGPEDSSRDKRKG